MASLPTPAPPGYARTQYNPPQTLVRSSHSITIYVNGQVIGLINGWSPQQSRQISPIYELNADTSGLILEKVPGNVQGLTIAVNRFDIWPARMEQAFGTVDLTMLSNQQSPFSCQEFWTSPSGAVEQWVYSGVWFSSIGRNIRSDDARIVNTSATLEYTYKQLLQGIAT